MRRGVRLPRRDLALAALARGEAHVHGLLHGLVDRVHGQAQQRADAGRLRRAEVGDVVYLVLVQADGAHEVYVNLVARGEAAQQLGARLARLLRHGQNRRDVVAGVAVVGGEEGVVHVQLAHRRAVGPGGPFRADPRGVGQAEHGGPVLARRRGVPQRHVARGDDGVAVDGGHGHGGVVDDAVDDHLGHLVGHRRRVGGDFGDLPGELVLALQPRFGWMHLDVVQLHALAPAGPVLFRFGLRPRPGPRQAAPEGGTGGGAGDNAARMG